MELAMHLTYVVFREPDRACRWNIGGFEALGHNVQVWARDADALILADVGEVIAVDASADVYAAERYCRRLSELGTEVPVVAIVPERSVSRVSLSWGISDFVLDSGGAVEMLVRMTRIVRDRRRLMTETRLQRGRHTLDHEQMTLVVGGIEIALTKVEHALLSVFFSRPNTVVTREELLQQCWDKPLDVSSRTIDTAVCRMRKKLGAEGPSIVTVRYLGYTFSPEHFDASSSAGVGTSSDRPSSDIRAAA